LAAADKNYTEAEQYVTRGLGMLERAGEHDRLQYANAEIKLARIYIAHQKYHSAEPLLRHALEIEDAVYRKPHVNTALCLAQLGLVLEKQQNTAEAEDHYKRSIAMYEQVAPRNPNLVAVLNRYSAMLKNDRRAEAKLLARRARKTSDLIRSGFKPKNSGASPLAF
jgi:tetratricopeptide (TPR) repeat protein